MFSTDTRGKSGIGTLILLISIIVVALIAAGVVIYMASYIREQIDQLPYLSATAAACVYLASPSSSVNTTVGAGWVDR